MNKIRDITISILIPNIIGLISALISDISNNIDTFNKPIFNPPGIVFPIVWTILYILMGISSYLIYIDNSTYKKKPLLLYTIQLIINGIWSIVFFKYKLFLLSFILIIILIMINIYIIIEYYKINKTAAFLQIPYIIWLLFASILSYGVYLLN